MSGTAQSVPQARQKFHVIIVVFRYPSAVICSVPHVSLDETDFKEALISLRILPTDVNACKAIVDHQRYQGLEECFLCTVRFCKIAERSSGGSRIVHRPASYGYPDFELRIPRSQIGHALIKGGRVGIHRRDSERLRIKQPECKVDMSVVS